MTLKVPAIEEAIAEIAEESPRDISYVLVNVGERGIRTLITHQCLLSGQSSTPRPPATSLLAAAYRSPDHPLRTNPRLGLKGIPSLFHISRGVVVKKFEVGLCDGAAMAEGGLEKVKELVREFAK